MSPEELLEAHRVVLEAVFTNDRLGSALVLKGAHAVRLVAGFGRATADIDLTMALHFDADPDVEVRLVERAFREALEDYFEDQAPHWSTRSVTVTRKPKRTRHRFGWDAYAIKATVAYKRAHRVVNVDLSFGDLTEGTVPVELGAHGVRVMCYSREQLVAEKLRAFLQNLPPHRAKVGGRPASVPRVRDLGDIHRLHHLSGPPLDLDAVARAFRTKCEAKSVDCTSRGDFAPAEPGIESYRRRFEEEGDFPDLTFDEVWDTVMRLVDEIERLHGLPGRFALPDVVGT